jgi:Domain of unknown function (DUF397)
MEGKGVNWRKSSFSGNGGGNCIEVGTTEQVLVRDTKDNGAGSVLSFSTAAWTAFTSALKKLRDTREPPRSESCCGVVFLFMGKEQPPRCRTRGVPFPVYRAPGQCPGLPAFRS